MQAELFKVSRHLLLECQPFLGISKVGAGTLSERHVGHSETYVTLFAGGFEGTSCNATFRPDRIANYMKRSLLTLCQRECNDSAGQVRVHGETFCVATRRRAARVHRLRAGGQITEVRHRPYSVILFDEM
eukprot:GHVT01048839.1.p1 GENE.GHVT01048839.1~~GHVT01048839.1.p1  ORF type:complete len:130 (-),score=3.64 GHVT01048839.1:1195-1584(-)